MIRRRTHERVFIIKVMDIGLVCSQLAVLVSSQMCINQVFVEVRWWMVVF